MKLDWFSRREREAIQGLIAAEPAWAEVTGRNEEIVLLAVRQTIDKEPVSPAARVKATSADRMSRSFG